MLSTIAYNEAAAKNICENCGSPSAIRSQRYFRCINFKSNGNVWSKFWYDGETPVAFYYCSRCKTHIRLIQIAVRNDYQGKGIGKKVLYDLLARMRGEGIYKLTFRTPIDENAYRFWAHIGARTNSIKGNDYEMEITIE